MSGLQVSVRGLGGSTLPRGHRAPLAPPQGRTARLNATLAALTAAGADQVDVQPVYDLAVGSVADERFNAEVIARGLVYVTSAEWPCESEFAELPGSRALHRGPDGGVFEVGDTIVSVRLGRGWCWVGVAGAALAPLAETIDAFALAFPPLYRAAAVDVVPITFWANGRFGPTSRLRMIDAATWEAIEGNYTAAARDELARLMTGFEPGKDGQLLLWQGPPGTGKTWALRALASEWADWAEFNYITDPDAFFVTDPSYMVDVLLHDSYEMLSVETDDVVTADDPGGKWRVLVLEDTGELLSADAKEQYGQGLSRLLNVVDGMIGQGLRVLAIITTNDELGDLHPAAVRPGRCASRIEFGPLTEDEATAWIAAHTPEGDWVYPPAEGGTLAELYQRIGAAEEALDEPDPLVDELTAAFAQTVDPEIDELVALAAAPLELEYDNEPEPEPVEDEQEFIEAMMRSADPELAAALDVLGASHRTTVEGAVALIAAAKTPPSRSDDITLAAIEALRAFATRPTPPPTSPPPPGDVHVHMPAHDLNVHVDAPTVEPRIDVHVPAQAPQPAPVVHVAAAAPQPAPDVHVHVPEQRLVEPPVVNVNVQPPPPRAVRVEYDDDGSKRFVQEEIDTDE